MNSMDACIPHGLAVLRVTLAMQFSLATQLALANALPNVAHILLTLPQ